MKSKKPVTADSLRAMKPSRRAKAFARLTPEEQKAVTVPCVGEAHTEPHIDNCGCCLYLSWGRMLAPSEADVFAEAV